VAHCVPGEWLQEATAGRPVGRSEQVPKNKPTAPDAPAHWHVLTNHAQVLLCLAADPQVTMREVAARVGITERAVQRIVSELAATGHVTITKVGRRNQYVVRRDIPLPGPIVDGRPAGWLFEALERKARPK
jgi:predicted transcriptional regulator